MDPPPKSKPVQWSCHFSLRCIAPYAHLIGPHDRKRLAPLMELLDQKYGFPVAHNEKQSR